MPVRTAGGPCDYLDPEQRQLCWAHLVRDFTAHSEGLGAQQQFGAAGLQVAAGLFKAWGEFRADGDRGRLLERIAPLQEELRALLGRRPPQPPATVATAPLRRTC